MGRMMQLILIGFVAAVQVETEMWRREGTRLIRVGTTTGSQSDRDNGTASSDSGEQSDGDNAMANNDNALSRLGAMFKSISSRTVFWISVAVIGVFVAWY